MVKSAEKMVKKRQEQDEQKSIPPIAIAPPKHLKKRMPREEGKRSRYHLPLALESGSPIAFRKRVALDFEETSLALSLLSLPFPREFIKSSLATTDKELFEESALSTLSARQATNFRGHKTLVLSPRHYQKVAKEVASLKGLMHPSLANATHSHFVFSRPYRTPFTAFLTFVGHLPLVSLITVPLRALKKWLFNSADIPSITYMEELHLGILADTFERAAVIASYGKKMAQVITRPFLPELKKDNAAQVAAIVKLIPGAAALYKEGYRLALIAHVGEVEDSQKRYASLQTWQKIGANLMAFRSERIMPGVNNEEKAPDEYQSRQNMRVPDELALMAGRALYNGFYHWTSIKRERAKDLVLLERVDVLTPGGKERLEEICDQLAAITDRIVKRIPLWADLALGRSLSKNAKRGKKAFALAGQRIYIGGLCKKEIKEEGILWSQALQGLGAGTSRGALVAEFCGVYKLPKDCDLLAGVCVMAGPVNQNDIGKTFFGYPDLLKKEFPDHDPSSLLFWTLKAKTVTDPIGNEEQLMSQKRKGALVDLRPAPHEIISVVKKGETIPFRKRGELINTERAFFKQDNFIKKSSGEPIEGNEGKAWSQSEKLLFD